MSVQLLPDIWREIIGSYLSFNDRKNMRLMSRYFRGVIPWRFWLHYRNLEAFRRKQYGSKVYGVFSHSKAKLWRLLELDGLQELVIIVKYCKAFTGRGYYCEPKSSIVVSDIIMLLDKFPRLRFTFKDNRFERDEFFFAVEIQNLELLKAFHRMHKAEFNQSVNKSHNGSTLLMYAIHSNAIYRYLIRHGADVNLRDDYGYTAQDCIDLLESWT